MKNVLQKNEMRKIAQLREKSICIASEYVKNVSELDFMRKNSNYTAEKVKKYVCNFLIQNESICRVFAQRIDKLLKAWKRKYYYT